MTAQFPDRVLYDGDEYITYDEPLSFYKELPQFLDLSTENIKGYVAVWTIIVDRLFIVSLCGYVPGRTDKGLRLAFPDVQEPVFADWYSGELKLRGGQLLGRSEIWPIYEREVVLTVRGGRIQGFSLLDRTGEPVAQEFDSSLFYPVEFLEGLSCDVIGLIRGLGVSRLGDLVQFDGLDLVKATGLDVDAIIEIKNELSALGLAFGMRLQGWPPSQMRPL